MEILKDKFVAHVKQLLEKFGFRDVKIKVVRLPERYDFMLADLQDAEKMSYMEVATHLGNFGIVPGEDGLVFDLTGLGLKCGDLARYGLADRGDEGFLISFPDDASFGKFKNALETRKNNLN